MTLSAAFTVEGIANPAVHHVAYGSTVDLALLSTDGATSIVWIIMACSDPGEAIPAITPSGTPSGATASFVMPMDSGDTLGRSFLVRCTVTNQVRGVDGVYQTAYEYAVIGAENSQGEIPFCPGERNYRHGTHGWTPELNRMLNASGGGGGGGGSGGGWTDDGTIVRLTSTSDSVTIGTAALSGTEKLRVIGNSRFEQVAASAGNPKAFYISGAAHTALTAGAEVIDFDLALDRIVQHATGAVTSQRAAVVRAPAYSFVGSSTITDAATFAITGAPTAGTNATITNSYALWVQAGSVRIGALGAGVMFTTSTGVVSRLAYGSALQVLRMNSGGTALEFTSHANLNAPVNPTDDGKVAIASAGNLSYALLANANVAAAAAIAGTKISPDFGSQGVVTTGYYSVGSNPATTGQLRLAYGALVYGRSQDNTSNLKIVEWGVGGVVNNLGIGDGTNTSTQFYGGSLNFYNGSTEKMRITGTTVSVRNVNTFQFDSSGVTNPQITMGDEVANTATAQAMTLHAQDCTGTTAVTAGALTVRGGDATGASGTRTGGAVTIRSGTGGTADGTLTLQKGSTVVFQATNGGSTTVSASGDVRFAVGSTVARVVSGSLNLLSGNSIQFEGGGLVAASDSSTSGLSMTLRSGDYTGTIGATAGAMTIRAGDATGASGVRNGGALTIRSGTGASTDGEITLQAGATYVFKTSAGETLLNTQSGSMRMQIAGTSRLVVGSSGIGVIGTQIFFDNTVSTPEIFQQTDTGASAVGDAFTVHAQDTSGNGSTAGAMTLRAGDSSGASGTRTGGALTIRSGTGASADGNVTIQRGSSIGIQLVRPSSGNVIGFCRTSTLSSTQMPPNTGNDVIYIGEAAAMPTTGFPASGGILGVDTAYGLEWKGKNGVETTLAAHGDSANTTKRRFIDWKTRPQLTSIPSNGVATTCAEFDVASFNGSALSNGTLAVKAHYVARDAGGGYATTNEILAYVEIASGTVAVGTTQTPVFGTSAVGSPTSAAVIDNSGTTVRLRLTTHASATHAVAVWAFLEVTGYER